MKIGFLKAIYPRLNKERKNIKWRNLSDVELDRSMKQPQIVANCFEEAVRYSLLASKKGREHIRERIKIQSNSDIEPAYKCKFNINGKDEVFRATKNDYFGRYQGLREQYQPQPYAFGSFNLANTRISLGVNICVAKMIKKHPSMKPFLSRLAGYGFIENRSFEFNKPSNAFIWFTGKKPLIIGESELNLNLKRHKKEIINLFDKLSKKKHDQYSFVAMTGVDSYRGIDDWHTLPITNIDGLQKKVTLHDTRTRQEEIFTYDEIINNFKGIIGMEH